MAVLLVLAVVVVLVVVMLRASIRVVPAQRKGVVERHGRPQRTLEPGLHLVTPFAEQVRLVDLREQRVTIPAEPLRTDDGLAVATEVVVHFEVIDARTAA